MVARRKYEWPLAYALSVVVLLLPGIYNGFPLLFPDTDAYMKVTYGHSWTLDRSGFYGLFLRGPAAVLGGSAGLWLGVTVQACIVAAILVAVIRRAVPSITPVPALAVILICAALTSLPWHSAQLMPDAFAGPLVLLVWLTATRGFGRPGTALLWLAAAFLALTHYTYLGLFGAAAGCALFMTVLFRVPAMEIAKRAAAAVSVIAWVICAHVAANGMLFDRWTISPAGSWFLFARLNEDGLVPAWLDRHCGKDAPAPLCDLKPRLPRDSQVLLWSKNSPLYPHIHAQIGSAEYWRWMDMFSAADRGSIAEQPLAFLGNAVAATGRQFASFQALDDECPSECTSPALIGYNPAVAGDVRSSRQLRDTLPKTAVRIVTGVTTVVALLLAIPFAIVAGRRRDWEALSLVLTAAVGILANAALAGALSDVHERYQSRVVWIVPFVEVLLLLRWKAATAAETGRDTGKNAPQKTATANPS